MENTVEFENKYAIGSQEAIELIKAYFIVNFENAILLDEYAAHTGCWGIRYSYQEAVIIISGGRGILEEIIVDFKGEQMPLHQFDRRVAEARVVNKKNLLFILDVLKRLMQD
jgi:hypothetical protein